MARAAAKAVRARPAHQHSTCQDDRRKRGADGTWRTERCNVPLFAEAHRAAGRCQWCIDGHNHADNEAVSALKGALP